MHPGASPRRFDAVPVAWAQAGLEAWMAGEPVAHRQRFPSARPCRRGNSWSTGSRWLPAFAERAGAVARDQARRARAHVELATLAPGRSRRRLAYADLRYCTFANDARSVACVRDGHVIVMLVPAAESVTLRRLRERASY